MAAAQAPQAPSSPPVSSSSRLPPLTGRVIDTAASDYANIMIYGSPGAGKTVLAATGKPPILYLDVEDGLLSIKAMKKPGNTLAQQLGIDLNQIYAWPTRTHQELIGHIVRLHEEFKVDPNRYGTICLDNLTELQRIMMSDIISVRGEQVRMPEQRDYGVLLAQMQRVIRQLKRLPCHTIFTAHELYRNDKYGPALMGQIYTELPGSVDMLLRYVMTLRQTANEKTGEIVQTSVRALRCAPIVGMEVKCRGGLLDEWETPNLRTMFAKMFG